MSEPQSSQENKPKNGLIKDQAAPEQVGVQPATLTAEHNIDRYTTQILRKYILPILLQRSDETCENCGKFSEAWDIDHKEYGPHVTINELQLLCPPCHDVKTGRENSEYARIKRVS